jgi:hypothetical protein
MSRASALAGVMAAAVAGSAPPAVGRRVSENVRSKYATPLDADLAERIADITDRAVKPRWLKAVLKRERKNGGRKM